MTGAIPSGPSVVEHRNGCALCNELFGNNAELGHRLAEVASRAPQGLTEQLRATESLIAHERGMRAFLRSRSTRVRLASSLALPAILLVRELLNERVPLREFGASRVLAGLLLLGLLVAVTSSALQTLPSERGAARFRSLLAWVAWCLPCMLWFAHAAPVGEQEFSSTDFWLRALICFGYGSALAAPSFLLLWAFDRGARVPFRVWALAAGLVGVSSNLILLLHCPNTQAMHLLAGHFSIGLAWFLAVLAATCWGNRVR